MSKILGILILGVIILCTHAGTGSAYLVDTGQGPSWIGYDLGGTSNQQLAAEFSLDKPSIITSIEGWMYSWTGGDLIVAIYDDGGEVPGIKLRSAVFYLSHPDIDRPYYESNWHGATGLNWSLDPDTYWVAFETPASGSAYAGMPFPSQEPLVNEAHMVSGSNYIANDGLDIGVRIDGSQVPIPGALLLLGAGLVRLANYRRCCGRAQPRRIVIVDGDMIVDTGNTGEPSA